MSELATRVNLEAAQQIFGKDHSDRFLMWEPRPSKKGKTVKVPFYFDADGQGVTKDWTKHGNKLERCLKAIRSKKGAIGLGVKPGGRLVIFDFDKCWGRYSLTDFQSKLLATLGSNGAFIEVSPSGNGLHAFWWTDRHEAKEITHVYGRKEHAGVEVYCNSGFVTFTGEEVKGKWGKGIVDPLNWAKHTIAAEQEEYARERSGVSIEHARECLEQIDPACSYDRWLRVAAGLKHEFGGTEHEEEAKELWREWSDGAEISAKNTGANDIDLKWRSLNREGGRLVTWASIESFAREEDKLDPAAMFDDLEDPLAGIEDESEEKTGTKWIIKGVLPERGIGFLTAGRSVGKTTFTLLAMCAPICSGKPFHPIAKVQGKGSVLFLSNEWGTANQRTLLQAAKDFGFDPQAVIVDGRKGIIGPKGIESDQREEILEVLRGAKRKGRPVKLVVIDTGRSHIKGGSINDDEGVEPLLEFMRWLALRGCFALTLWHPSRAGSKNGSGAPEPAGSYSVEGAADMLFTLESSIKIGGKQPLAAWITGEVEEVPPRDASLLFSCTKNRDGDTWQAAFDRRSEKVDGGYAITIKPNLDPAETENWRTVHGGKREEAEVAKWDRQQIVETFEREVLPACDADGVISREALEGLWSSSGLEENVGPIPNKKGSVLAWLQEMTGYEFKPSKFPGGKGGFRIGQKDPLG